MKILHKIRKLLKHPKPYALIFNAILSRIKSAPYYAWYITRVERYKILREGLNKYYHRCDAIENCPPFVISIFDGKIIAGGLADRLRGALSTYYVCKKTGKDFRLYFVSPFNLENYLLPNKYDWRCKKEELCYNENSTKVLILDTTQDSPYQREKQKQWLYCNIKNASGQCHVYSNALFSYDYEYKKLFEELFKPSERLKETIDFYLKDLGETYISISCRFLDLLGDFNETFGIKTPLTKQQKEELISKVICTIKKLHIDYPNRKILCNSDSSVFLKEVEKLEYTYVVPGEITHIDGKNDRDDYKMYEKTFVDFFLIANASHIFLLKTGSMHNSGYPLAASKIYNKPFETITF